jgi:metal-dependent hydrolase (beta-lactamase superfamily II)
MRQADHQVKEISTKLKRLRVKKIAPSHCTGEQAIKIFEGAPINLCTFICVWRQKRIYLVSAKLR